MPAVSIVLTMALAIAMLATWILVQPLRLLPGRWARRAVALPTALGALIGVALLIGKLIVVVGLWNKEHDLVVEPLGAVAILAVVLAICLALILRGSWRAARRGTSPDAATVAAVTGAVAGGWWLALTWGAPAASASIQITLTLLVVGIPLVISLWGAVDRRQQATDPARRSGRLGRTLSRAALINGAWIGALAVWSVRETRATAMPGTMNMGAGDGMGGAMAGMSHTTGDTALDVSQLTGPHEGRPDRRFELTAAKTTATTDAGVTIDGWGFNGQLPGPELRMKQGELIEIVVRNKDIADGVTTHWHGLNVPNAEDGVPGITQDAILPGKEHVYRFRAEQVGTYWYHSHQHAAEQVQRGLFGPIVIEPATDTPAWDHETVTIMHAWDESGPIDGLHDEVQNKRVALGGRVRARFINTENKSLSVELGPGPVRVVAVDGVDLHEPAELDGVRLEVTGGGRADLLFEMRDTPVALIVHGRTTIVWSTDGVAANVATGKSDRLDLTAYGTPAPTPFDAGSHFDREIETVLGERFGFYEGSPDYVYTIDGKVFPNTPMLMARRGELVKVRFVHQGMSEHPMHLHGHHMLVLKHNGRSITGGPWWTDTLGVHTGDVVEVAFKADNPGIWMDHCHNLPHAAHGMMMHLAYEDVTTPYRAGPDTINHPE